ncbi:MAG: putative zinc-binding metallopeptidase [Prevotellaceae bacterium]|jgi:substrate import-associated zinc metallohydrolase lipoprotein|nr:putative zinc-binding metallopeptidase [Prevotellaceae bacterium]
MKKINLYILVALLSIGFLASCNKEDDLDMNHEILGLGGDIWEKTEIDYWIYDNYTKPYNIDIKYKWDQYELDYNRMLVPMEEEKVIPIMNAVKKVWIDPYEALAGANFIKALSPKKFVLVGSAKYNPSNGTITLGEAEGGRKIVLYRLNWFDPSDKALVQRIMKTVHHEFGHTMHQRTMFSQEFTELTAEGYTSSWTNTDDTEAIQLGFVSTYARNNYDEDFVETLSFILVYGRTWFDNRVALAQAAWDDPSLNLKYNPAEKLRQKETIIKDYLKTVWGIELYDLDDGTIGLETKVQQAIVEVTSGL